MTGFRIWLDDIRTPPDSNYIWCKTVEAAEKLVTSGKVDFISFDHDLGNDIFTGYSLAVYIESLAYSHKIKPIGYNIHSANPVGRERIEMAMKKAEEYWQEK